MRLLAGWAIQELGLRRVEAYVPVDNEASQRSIERAGFTQEGVARAVFDNQRDRVDLAQYSLVRADLPRKRRRRQARLTVMSGGWDTRLLLTCHESEVTGG